MVDALDAVDTLGDGQVRRRAGWVVSAIRQGWDLDDLLAERRQLEARHTRWEHERDERDRQAARWRARESAAGAWRAAVSAMLDDQQLAVAVERVTTPVAGLGRRSVPIVRAQLLAWAVTAHRDAAGRPLADVLADDLAGPDRTVSAPSLDGPLPPIPAGVGQLEDDLTDRLTGLLARRSDLAHPRSSSREWADAALIVRSTEGSDMSVEPDPREYLVSPHETCEFRNAVEYTVQITFVVAGGARGRTGHGWARRIAERLANTAARAKHVVEVHAVAGTSRHGELLTPGRVCFEAANSGHGTNVDPARLDRYLDPDYERGLASLAEAHAAAPARRTPTGNGAARSAAPTLHSSRRVWRAPAAAPTAARSSISPAARRPRCGMDRRTASAACAAGPTTCPASTAPPTATSSWWSSTATRPHSPASLPSWPDASRRPHPDRIAAPGSTATT